MQILRNLISGIILGIANIIPGVSGGTMAVVLNLYDPLIAACHPRRWRQNLSFLLTVAAGALTGILLFSRLLAYLLAQHTLATHFFFMGLILGSIPMIYQRAKGGRSWHWWDLIPFLIALGVMLLTVLGQGAEAQQQVVTQLTPWVFLRLMVVSLISTFAMILPGISGSFMLLVMGSYTTVLTAIGQWNLPILLPVALGVVLGLVVGTQIIRVLLERFTHPTYVAILGLVVGSLFSVYPGFSWGGEGIVAVVLLLAAAAGAYLFSRQEGN